MTIGLRHQDDADDCHTPLIAVSGQARSLRPQRTGAGIGDGRPVRGDRDHCGRPPARRGARAAGQRADGAAGLSVSDPRCDHRDGRCRCDRLLGSRLERLRGGRALRLCRRAGWNRETRDHGRVDRDRGVLWRRCCHRCRGGHRVDRPDAASAADVPRDHRRRGRSRDGHGAGAAPAGGRAGASRGSSPEHWITGSGSSSDSPSSPSWAPR